jgi:hypothetical protein
VLAKKIEEQKNEKPKKINFPINAVNTAQIMYILLSLLPVV